MAKTLAFTWGLGVFLTGACVEENFVETKNSAQIVASTAFDGHVHLWPGGRLPYGFSKTS